MGLNRTIERVKKLKIEPLNHTQLHFYASLEDTGHSDAGVEVVHALSIKGVISLPDLKIETIEPKASHQPYQECSASLEPVRQLVGVCIGPGFRVQVQNLLGRTHGCTHFLSLVLDLAASHTLSLFLRMRDQASFKDRNLPDSPWLKVGLAMEPRLENACIALTSDSPKIKKAKGQPE